MNKFKIHKRIATPFFLGVILIAGLTSGCGDSSTSSPQTPASQNTNSSATSQSTSSSTQKIQIKGIGTGCEDRYCIWIQGSNFAPNSVIELRKTGDSGQPIAKYTEVDRSTQAGDQLITFAIKEPEAKAVLNNPGVKIRVVNPDNSYAESETIIRQTGK